MKPRALSSNTPNPKFIVSFAGAVVPARMPGFPNPHSRRDFGGHGRVNTKRAANRHVCEGVFRRPTVTGKRSNRNRNVGLYEHVNLQVQAIVYRNIPLVTTPLCGMSIGTPAGTESGTRRDTSGRGTPGRRRDGGGIYNYVISPDVPSPVCADPGVPAAGFPDWFEVVFDGQSFRPIGVKPYSRADGEESVIVIWESQCAECGVAFQFNEGRKLNIGRKRRCDGCKAPGKGVRRS